MLPRISALSRLAEVAISSPFCTPYTGNSDRDAASKIENTATATSSIGALGAKSNIPEGLVSSGPESSVSRISRKGRIPNAITTAPSTNGVQPSMPMKLINNGPAPKLPDSTLA